MPNGEVTTLLDNQQQRQSQQQATQSRRSHALRVAVGVVSALALVAGSCVAVELISEKQQHQVAVVQTSSLSAPASANMEAALGWDTWCSMRASVQCLFSSNKDKCKKDIMASCAPEEENKDDDEHEHGDGSGSGSRLGHGSSSGSHYHEPEVGDPEHNTTTKAPHKKHRKKHPKGTKATAAPATL